MVLDSQLTLWKWREKSSFQELNLHLPRWERTGWERLLKDTLGSVITTIKKLKEITSSLCSMQWVYLPHKQGHIKKLVFSYKSSLQCLCHTASFTCTMWVSSNGQNWLVSPPTGYFHTETLGGNGNPPHSCQKISWLKVLFSFWN